MTVNYSDLIENEDQLYQTFVENSDDGILLTSADGICLHVNETGHRLLGYRDSELNGRPLKDILREDNELSISSSLCHSGKKQLILKEWFILHKDGSEVCVDIHAQRLATGFMLVVLRDRTEQLNEENRNRELLERIQKIAGQLPGMVYQYKLYPDGRTCFPYASDFVRKIYRVSPEQIREDADCLFSVIHPDDCGDVIESIKLSAQKLRPWQHEYRVKFDDGEIRWLYGNAIPELEVDGSVLWHGFITDITDQKLAEEKQLLLETQLIQSQKVESIGRLAGGVAHDFNNLLTSMLGFSELAMDEVSEDSQAYEYLHQVVETARRGAALTHKLLAFARKKIIQPEVLSLSDVVEQLVPMMERLVGDDIEIDINLSDKLSTTLIDCSSFEQVVMNLVVNARDAMPMGGKISLSTCDCELSASYTDTIVDLNPGSFVMLSVSDTGQGISKDVQERVFEPFFTTKAAGKGTGLGLATCFGIVKQAGGHIELDSVAGKGTRFSIFLPKAGKKCMSGPKAQKPAKVTLPPGQCTETILLVEDDHNILSLVEKTLSLQGYEVLCAGEAQEALDLLDEYDGSIDLLLTDVVLPKMNGKELATLVERVMPGVSVLYASGYTGDAIVNRGVLEQGIEFIGKPYSMQDLAVKVRDMLDKKTSQRHRKVLKPAGVADLQPPPRPLLQTVQQPEQKEQG